MARWQKSHTAVTVFLRLCSARCVGRLAGNCDLKTGAPDCLLSAAKPARRISSERRFRRSPNGHLPGAVNVPLADLRGRPENLPLPSRLASICKTERRRPGTTSYLHGPRDVAFLRGATTSAAMGTLSKSVRGQAFACSVAPQNPHSWQDALRFRVNRYFARRQAAANAARRRLLCLQRQIFGG